MYRPTWLSLQWRQRVFEPLFTLEMMRLVKMADISGNPSPYVLHACVLCLKLNSIKDTIFESEKRPGEKYVALQQQLRGILQSKKDIKTFCDY